MVIDLKNEGQTRALTSSTIAFTVCFAVWTIFSIIGLEIQKELELSETEFGLLIGTPILSSGKQGTALGIFGLGNVGAAVTKFCAPFVMVAMGWHAVAFVWAGGLLLTAVIFWMVTEDEPSLKARQAAHIKGKTFLRQFEPLKNMQVWRFSMYYFFVFGAFVALALWLPRYMIGVYGFDVKTAGMLAASYSIFASVFRAVGGWLSDRFGARLMMYWTFIVAAICTFILSYPPTDYIVHGIKGDIRFSFSIQPGWFVFLMALLGLFMSFGKAAVYKHIPVYFPKNVGSVGGAVGMIGGLGGFLLPLTFGMLNDLTNIWSSCFMLLFVIVLFSLAWMHYSIIRMERRVVPELAKVSKDLPELIHPSKLVLEDWNPEDRAFWETTGKRIAKRNLWISIPALLLAFAVWMV